MSCWVPRGSGLRGTVLLALLLQGGREARHLRKRGLEQTGRLGEVALHGAGQLGQQNLTRLEVSDLVDLVGRDRAALEDTALDLQDGVGLGEIAKTLGRLDRVATDEGERGRTGEQRVEALDARVNGRPLRERVLRHGV